MSNQIQPFDFNGIQVRILTDEHGNPWFLGADVCAILGTATNHIREYLDADEITNIRSTDIAQNGGKAPVFVSESGLYSLVLRSRKPEAREFKRWVTHEVLPSIRKHGAYMTESTLEKGSHRTRLSYPACHTNQTGAGGKGEGPSTGRTDASQSVVR